MPPPTFHRLSLTLAHPFHAIASSGSPLCRCGVEGPRYVYQCGQIRQLRSQPPRFRIHTISCLFHPPHGIALHSRAQRSTECAEGVRIHGLRGFQASPFPISPPRSTDSSLRSIHASGTQREQASDLSAIPSYTVDRSTSFCRETIAKAVGRLSSHANGPISAHNLFRHPQPVHSHPRPFHLLRMRRTKWSLGPSMYDVDFRTLFTVASACPFVRKCNTNCFYL